MSKQSTIENAVSAVTVAVGEARLAELPQMLMTLSTRGYFVLALYDPISRIGGMAHLRLPVGKDGALERYTLVAIQRLIAEMHGAGAVQERLVARLCFEPSTPVAAMRTLAGTLRWQGIRHIRPGTLAGRGRQIQFSLADGQLAVHDATPPPQIRDIKEVAIALGSQLLDLRSFCQKSGPGTFVPPIQSLWQQIAENASLMLGGARCFIAARDSDGKAIIRADSKSKFETRAYHPAGNPVSAQERMLAEWAANQRDALLLDDLAQELSSVPGLARSGVGSLMCVPLAYAEIMFPHEPEAVLCALHTSSHAFGQRSLQLLQFLAHQAAIGIQNARLYQQLQSKAAEMEAILQGIGDGIIVTDGDLRLIMANPVARQLLALRDDAPIGKPLPPDSALGRLLRQADGETPYSGEITLGSTICQATVSRITSSEGQVRGIVSVLHDITAQREREQQRSNLLTVVSHELRTPLHTIGGFVDIILMGKTGELNETQRDFLTTVKRQSAQLQTIINDLLEFSRLEYGPLKLTTEPVDLSEVARNVLRKFSLIAAQDRITLVDAMPQSLPFIQGDSVRLEQVLTNLVDNALKFTPSGGQVRVGASDREDEIEMWVADTGIGIPLTEQEKIFTKFYQIPEGSSTGRRGAGLGLTICKHIVERHGGRIWVESAPGQGSTFHFVLRKSALESAEIALDFDLESESRTPEPLEMLVPTGLL